MNNLFKIFLVSTFLISNAYSSDNLNNSAFLEQQSDNQNNQAKQYHYLKDKFHGLLQGQIDKIDHDNKWLDRLNQFNGDINMLDITDSDIRQKFNNIEGKVKDAQQNFMVKVHYEGMNLTQLNKLIGDPLDNNSSLPKLLESIIQYRNSFYAFRFKTREIAILQGYEKETMPPNVYIDTSLSMVKSYSTANQQRAQEIIDYIAIYNIMMKELYCIIPQTELTDYTKQRLKKSSILSEYLTTNSFFHPVPDDCFKDIESEDLDFKDVKDYSDSSRQQQRLYERTKQKLNEKVRKNLIAQRQAEQKAIANKQEQQRKQALEQKNRQRRQKDLNRQQQAEQKAIAEAQEQQLKKIQENRRHQAVNQVQKLDNQLTVLSSQDELPYIEPKPSTGTSGYAFNQQNTQDKVKTRGIASEQFKEETETSQLTTVIPQFQTQCVGTRIYKKFIEFWDSSAGTTYDDFRTWGQHLGIIFDEKTGSSHIHIRYTDNKDKKHSTTITNHHGQDAYGKGTTNSIKKFLTECGLITDFVQLKKEKTDFQDQGPSN